LLEQSAMSGMRLGCRSHFDIGEREPGKLSDKA
jgi:hypothetical protein